MKFAEIDEKRQGSLNMKLIEEKGKLEENVEFFSEFYRGTYVFK